MQQFHSVIQYNQLFWVCYERVLFLQFAVYGAYSKFKCNINHKG